MIQMCVFLIRAVRLERDGRKSLNVNDYGKKDTDVRIRKIKEH
jgi:hypothetical protein